MKRKLIKQGVGGLTLCIPKQWTEKHNLKAGDEVILTEEQEKLTLTTESKPALVKKEIIIDEHSYEFMTRLVTNAYKKGVDELKLKFKRDIPLERINKALSTLTIGYEITDVEKDYCVIQSFSAEQEDNIAISIRKCFFLIREMQELIQEEMTYKKGDNDHKIKALNENVRKLTNYAIRTTSKTVHDNNIIQYNALLFSNLYLYSIKLTYIYQQIGKEKRIMPNTREIMNNLCSLFDIFYDTYYKQQLSLAHQFLQHKEKLVKELDTFIDKGNGKILLQISMAMRCLHDSIGAMIGLIIK